MNENLHDQLASLLSGYWYTQTIYVAAKLSLAEHLKDGSAPYFRWFAKNRRIKDVPTALLAVITLAVLMRFRKVPEPLVIFLAGIIGLVITH